MYSVRLKNNETGETFLHSVDLEWTGDFWWTDGSMRCDCNRERAYFEYKGIEPPSYIPCGDQKYSVIEAIMDDGTTISLEDG
jgi:hypothetical protein